MPILKQLAQNGAPQGKRRLRAELTREMISAPLGDFRHTMHVGRGGEAFGDTSFLSRTGGGGEGEEEEGEERGEEEGKGKAGGGDEGRGKAGGGEAGGEEEGTGKAGGGEEGRGKAGGGEERDGEEGDKQQHKEEEEGGRRKGPSGQEEQAPQGVASSPPCSIQPAESLLSLFQVDLGPSMLSEVLGVMEKGPRSVSSPEPEPLERGDEQAGERRGSVPGEDNVVEEEEEEGEEEEGRGFIFEDEEEQEDEEIRM